MSSYMDKMNGHNMNEIMSRFPRRRVVIYGAGRGGKIIFEILSMYDNIKLIGFVDDDTSLFGQYIFDIKVLGGREELENLKHHAQMDAVIVSIASPNTMSLRKKIYIDLKNSGYQFINAIHPTAVVSPSAKLGENNILSPGVVVDTEASLGDNNRLCVNSSLDHHSSVGCHNFLGPKCALSSLVSVGDDCVFEIGTGVAPLIPIGSDIIVSAGTIVTKPLTHKTQN